MAVSQTGFDVDRFISPVDDDLVCSICHGVFRNPMTLLCEHIFCQSCIELWLKKNKTCPICQLAFEGQGGCWRSPRIVVSILSKLRLRCSKYCGEVFKLEEIGKHEEGCSEIVICPIKKCKVEQVKFDEHLREHCVEDFVSAVKSIRAKVDGKTCEDLEENDLKGEVSRLRQSGFFSWVTPDLKCTPPENVDAAVQNDLLEAVKAGDFKLVKSIVSTKKVDINVSNKKHLLSVAIVLKNENIALLLIKYGADTGLVTAQGNSVTHWAAEENMPEVLELTLVFSKLKHLNSKNNQGETPLHMAARKGSSEAIKILLQYKADTTLTNSRDKTAREIAFEYRQHESFLLLTT